MKKSKSNAGLAEHLLCGRLQLNTEQKGLERIAVRWREGLKVRFIFLPLRDSLFAGTASQQRSAGSSSTSTGKLPAPPSVSAKFDSSQTKCGACFDTVLALKFSAFPVRIGRTINPAARQLSSFYWLVYRSCQKCQLCCKIRFKIPLFLFFFFFFLLNLSVNSDFTLRSAGSVNIRTIKLNKIKLFPCHLTHQISLGLTIKLE